MGNRSVCNKKILCHLIYPTFNITPGRSPIASKFISEVSLLVHKNFFICKVYKSPVNRSIPVRMIFHCSSHNILNFLKIPVINFKKSVKNSALNRFKTVFQIGNCPVANNIRSVFNKIFVKNIFYKCHKFS